MLDDHKIEEDDLGEEGKLVTKNSFEIGVIHKSDPYMNEGGEAQHDEDDAPDVPQSNKFDIILDEIGGFGVYQLMYFNVIVTGMVSGAFILYSMNYFELEPAL